MPGKITIDASDFLKALDVSEDIITEEFQSAGEYFRNITPKRSGNARRRTRVTPRQIQARYPYAARLDSGYSDQAPRGMTEPAWQYFEKRLRGRFRRLS